MKQYLVWPDGDTREFAAEIEAVDPSTAAKSWLIDVEFAGVDPVTTSEIVTVAEDKEGSIEERFSVFCDVSITFNAHRFNDEAL